MSCVLSHLMNSFFQITNLPIKMNNFSKLFLHKLYYCTSFLRWLIRFSTCWIWQYLYTLHIHGWRAYFTVDKVSRVVGYLLAKVKRVRPWKGSLKENSVNPWKYWNLRKITSVKLTIQIQSTNFLGLLP